MSTDTPPPFDAPHPADTDEELTAPEPIAPHVADELARVPDTVKPPHSLEAEREVLSAVFLGLPVGRAQRPAMEVLVDERITPASFYFERHQVLFAVFLDLHERGTSIDIVTAQQALKDRGQYERIGGARTLGELLDRAGTVSNIEHYCGIVRDKARLRACIDEWRHLQALAMQDVHDVDAFVEAAKARTQHVLERVTKPPEAMALESIAERVARGEPSFVEDVPPDVSVLMRNPDGSPFMLNGRVSALSAAGGTGKSWVAVQLAVAVASGGRWLDTYECQKGRVLLALGEEQDPEIWRRVWAVCRHLRLSEYERGEVARNLVPKGLDGEEVAFLRKHPDGNIVPTQYFESLRCALAKGGPWKLVVLDPLSYFGGPEVETDPYVATQLIRCGSQLTRSPGGPAVLFSTHSRKKQQGSSAQLSADETRGSSAIVDGSRWVFSMARRSEAIIAAKVTKTNYTVAGPELALTRGKGGVLRPATAEEIAQDIEERKEARAKAKGL